MREQETVWTTRIGTFKTPESRRRSSFALRVGIGKLLGSLPTVDHRTLNSGHQLSVSGEVRYTNGHTPYMLGQTRFELGLVDRFQNGWTHELRDEIAAIWDAWHVNDLHAGCVHQIVVWEDTPYRRPDLNRIPPCPVTGYRYGSGWLYQPIPGAVLNRVTEIMQIVEAERNDIRTPSRTALTGN